jgi:hypothetical protein
MPPHWTRRRKLVERATWSAEITNQTNHTDRDDLQAASWQAPDQKELSQEKRPSSTEPLEHG